eukprot:gnl/TRDRNA2_/TRDRNA2_168918_c2_seq1.p1 gnl/TRDRNA2_/TRDRNA2_168918_c2~~gnl/TRDRNA2_/TRDRNA2_168918_c2_seq1.p1  ORF type:complete len:385 (-),score=49.95 gnl/TRDRNA2_/TRDRNA2_168918_c2_seq1:47-1111(-)
MSIIDHSPWTLIFFIAVHITLNTASLNLIMAAVVDCSMQARKGSLHEIAAVKKKHCERAKNRIKEICKKIDKDGSGDLRLEEMLEGIETVPEFRDNLKILDIEDEDMPLVFSMLDSDRSGSISYDEFVDQLYKMVDQDEHSMLVFIKAYLNDIRHRLADHLDAKTDGLSVEIADHCKQIADHCKQIRMHQQSCPPSNLSASPDLGSSGTKFKLEHAFSLTADSLASHIESLHYEVSTKLDESKAILNELCNGSKACNLGMSAPASALTLETTLATTAIHSPSNLDALKKEVLAKLEDVAQKSEHYYRACGAPIFKYSTPQDALSVAQIALRFEDRIDSRPWLLCSRRERTAHEI